MIFGILLAVVGQPGQKTAELDPQVLVERSVLVLSQLGIPLPKAGAQVLVQDLHMRICISYGTRAVSFCKVDGHLYEIESEMDLRNDPISVENVESRRQKYYDLFGATGSHFTQSDLRVSRTTTGEPRVITYVRLTMERTSPDQSNGGSIKQFVFRHGNGGGLSVRAVTYEEAKYVALADKLPPEAEMPWAYRNGSDVRLPVSATILAFAGRQTQKLSADDIRYATYGIRAKG